MRQTTSKANETLSAEALGELYIKNELHRAFVGTGYYLPQLFDPDAELQKARTIDQLPGIGSLDGDVAKLLARRLPDDQLSAEKMLKILEECAEEVSVADLPKARRLSLDDDLRPRFDDICSIHDETGQMQFVDRIGNPVLVYERLPYVIAVSLDETRPRVWQTGHLTFDLLMSILEGTWRYGRTRRAEARAALCDRYDWLIGEVRLAARNRLSAAVAIKDNGQELISADRVVVYSGTPQAPRATAYEAATFQPATIVIPVAKSWGYKEVKGTLEQVLTPEGVAADIVNLLARKRVRLLIRSQTGPVLFCHESVVDAKRLEGGVSIL